MYSAYPGVKIEGVNLPYRCGETLGKSVTLKIATVSEDCSVAAGGGSFLSCRNVT